MTDLELAVSLALEAGRAIERVRAAGFSTRGKADHSPVTEADLAADAVIRTGLTRERPLDAILSEESTGAAASPDQALWVVDPLDGTEAFVDGTDHYVRGYAVQIARLVPDGEGAYAIALGVTYEPRVDELFFAERGKGTFRARGAAPDGPLRVSSTEHPSPTLVSSSRIDPSLKRRLLLAGYRDGGAMRSVGVKVSRLILGEADVYPATHSLSWWDLAAPQLILEEAGGLVTDLRGVRPTYRHADLDRAHVEGPLLLSNGLAHTRALATLGALDRPLP